MPMDAKGCGKRRELIHDVDRVAIRWHGQRQRSVIAATGNADTVRRATRPHEEQRCQGRCSGHTVDDRVVFRSA
jgi:hypothetical protein